MPIRSEELIGHEALERELWPAHTSSASRVRFAACAGRTGSGSVFLPTRSPGPDGWPVVSYVHGLVGPAENMAPSRTGLTPLEREHLSHWLAQGYAVAVADYEHDADGRAQPFFIPDLVARDLVDVVRAARCLSSGLGRDWLLLGFSKGGWAALHAASIATGHAPELRFLGTATLVPAVSWTHAVRTGTERGASRIGPAALLMLAAIDAERQDLDIGGLLTPQGRALLAHAGRSTIQEVIVATEGVTNDQAGTTGIGENPTVIAELDARNAPVARFDRPVFIAASRIDQLVPYGLMDDYVRRLGDAGTEVHLSAEHRVLHVKMLEAGVPDALEWAAAVRRRSPAAAAPLPGAGSA